VTTILNVNMNSIKYLEGDEGGLVSGLGALHKSCLEFKTLVHPQILNIIFHNNPSVG